MGKIVKIIILTVVVSAVTACNYDGQAVGMQQKQAETSAWLAYWDLKAGGEEVTQLHKLTALCYFETYFDKNDHIFIPPELAAAKIGRNKDKYLHYLTFVNDKQRADGTFTLKDTKVLRRMFANDSSMDRHIEDIIAKTIQGGYDGMEIDYEKVWQDKQIQQAFLKFIAKLYQKAAVHKLQLRVVLEPSTPFSAAFPNGPEYVIMLYNLYGLHSGPGPKADKQFIQNTITRLSVLPGEKVIAFATGGCLWGDNNQKRLLTEEEAVKLMKTYKAFSHRDSRSQCVVFDYQEAGVHYEVWYADYKTLNYWIKLAEEQGEKNVSLWRLGGNVHIHRIRTDGSGLKP